MTPESYCEHYNETERSVQLLSRKQHLIKAIQQKEDTMRKLRLVQMYRTKVCKLVYTVDELFTFHESVRIFSSTSLSPTYPLPHTKVHYQLHVSNIKNVHGGEWPLTCQDSCGSLQNLPRISYDGHRS